MSVITTNISFCFKENEFLTLKSKYVPGAISKHTGQPQFLSRHFHPALPGDLLPPVPGKPIPVSEHGVLVPESSGSGSLLRKLP